MRFEKNTAVLVSGLVILVLIVVIFRSINVSIEKQVLEKAHKGKDQPVQVDLEYPAPSPVQKAAVRTLNPSDPVLFGIARLQDSMLVDNQRYWDSAIQKTVSQSDVIRRMSNGAFEGAKMSPQQYQKQIQRIEERIREVQRKVQANPADDRARQKLQDLYRMKSVIGSLEKAVIKR